MVVCIPRCLFINFNNICLYNALVQNHATFKITNTKFHAAFGYDRDNSSIRSERKMDQCYDFINILIKSYPLRLSPGVSWLMMIDEVIKIQGNILLSLFIGNIPKTLNFFKARKVGNFPWKENKSYLILFEQWRVFKLSFVWQNCTVCACCERKPVTFSWFLQWEKIFYY